MPVVLNLIRSSSTIISAEEGMLIATVPLGSSSAPPPTKPEPATTLTDTPLSKKLPVAIGYDLILFPSKYTKRFCVKKLLFVPPLLIGTCP